MRSVNELAPQTNRLNAVLPYNDPVSLQAAVQRYLIAVRVQRFFRPCRQRRGNAHDQATVRGLRRPTNHSRNDFSALSFRRRR